MKTQAITGTELQSSVFVLGTDGFSVSKTQAEAFAMMDGYLGLGGNHFDTAAIYPAPHLHQSEEIIGNYFTQRKNRSQVILATKGGHPPLGHMDVGRLTKKDLTEDLEKSLLALKTDYCDIYYLHRDDVRVPVCDIMDILASFVKAGKVRHLGVSNWRGERIAAANDYAKQNNLPPIVISQIRYSLAVTDPDHFDDATLVEMDETERAFYEKTGLSVASFSPQAKGFFQKLEKGEDLHPVYARGLDTKQNRKRFAAAKEIAEKRGVSCGAVALAYLQSQSFPVFPVLGARNLEQLKESMSQSELFLTKQELCALEGENALCAIDNLKLLF